MVVLDQEQAVKEIDRVSFGQALFGPCHSVPGIAGSPQQLARIGGYFEERVEAHESVVARDRAY